MELTMNIGDQIEFQDDPSFWGVITSVEDGSDCVYYSKNGTHLSRLSVDINRIIAHPTKPKRWQIVSIQ
jgi:hypothetical protein